MIVAKQDALDLVSYLQGMKHDYAPPTDGLRDDGYELMAADHHTAPNAATASK